MGILNKLWGATNTPSMSFACKDKTEGHHDSNIMKRLQEIRDTACYLAVKYRWDPALGRAHEEYLDMLNSVLKEYGSL